MATLQGRDQAGSRWISLTPCQPLTPGADATEYEFAAGSSEATEIVRRTYSIMDKQRSIAVMVYLQEPPAPERFERFFIQASVDAAQAFGMSLEAEILDASPVWRAECKLFPQSP